MASEMAAWLKPRNENVAGIKNNRNGNVKNEK